MLNSKGLVVLVMVISGLSETAHAEAPLLATEHIDFAYLRLAHLIHDIPSDMKELRKLLQTELDGDASYRKGWEEGKEIFESRRADLTESGKLDLPDEYHIALTTYSISDAGNPFYSIFNTATRNVCSGLQVHGFPYKSFFQLLRLAIDALKTKAKYQATAERLYRGLTIRYDIVEGQEVAFQQFTSVSVNKTVAEIYSGNVTLLEFTNVKNIGVNMQHHSKFPGEEEILVSPLQVYKVLELKKKSPGALYEEITMEPVDAGKFLYYKGGASSRFPGALLVLSGILGYLY